MGTVNGGESTLDVTEVIIDSKRDMPLPLPSFDKRVIRGDLNAEQHHKHNSRHHGVLLSMIRRKRNLNVNRDDADNADNANSDSNPICKRRERDARMQMLIAEQYDDGAGREADRIITEIEQEYAKKYREETEALIDSMSEDKPHEPNDYLAELEKADTGAYHVHIPDTSEYVTVAYDDDDADTATTATVDDHSGRAGAAGALPAPALPAGKPTPVRRQRTVAPPPPAPTVTTVNTVSSAPTVSIVNTASTVNIVNNVSAEPSVRSGSTVNTVNTVHNASIVDTDNNVNSVNTVDNANTVNSAGMVNNVRSTANLNSAARATVYRAKHASGVVNTDSGARVGRGKHAAPKQGLFGARGNANTSDWGRNRTVNNSIDSSTEARETAENVGLTVEERRSEADAARGTDWTIIVAGIIGLVISVALFAGSIARMVLLNSGLLEWTMTTNFVVCASVACIVIAVMQILIICRERNESMRIHSDDRKLSRDVAGEPADLTPAAERERVEGMDDDAMRAIRASSIMSIIGSALSIIALLILIV